MRAIEVVPELAAPTLIDAQRAGGGPPVDGGNDGDRDGGGDDGPGRDPRRGWLTVAAYWYPAQPHIGPPPRCCGRCGGYWKACSV